MVRKAILTLEIVYDDEKSVHPKDWDFGKYLNELWISILSSNDETPSEEEIKEYQELAGE